MIKKSLRRLFLLCTCITILMQTLTFAEDNNIKNVSSDGNRDPVFSYNQPPDGWNILTASNDELAKYCIDPRPSDPELLKKWVEENKNIKFVKADVKKGHKNENTLTQKISLDSINYSGYIKTVEPLQSVY